MTDEDETRDIRRVFVSRDQRRLPTWLAHGYAILTAERLTLTTEILGRELPGAEHPAIIDVGCGQGLDLEWWQQQGWPPEALAGIDLVEERVAVARLRNPGVDIRLGQGASLPFADRAFEVATASTVFSSIPGAPSRRALFFEMRRLVRAPGIIAVYDFVIRNPRNADVTPMTVARLVDLAGRPPDRTWRVSPLVYAVGPAAMIHPKLAGVVARLAPRTHRLSLWRV